MAKKITTAKHVTMVTILDPDTTLPVEISVYKEQSGGMFAIDSSYLENELDEDGIVPSLFGNGNVTLLD